MQCAFIPSKVLAVGSPVANPGVMMRRRGGGGGDSEKIWRRLGKPEGRRVVISRRTKFCSGLVDLVVGVGRDGGGGHRLTALGERFVGLVAEYFAEVGDRGAELGD